ncbi:MAG: VanW family protein [Chloroflexi bacterium]|nr:VanW family protein [Chloroflexota bacterium]MCY4247472.1 VanW family protein [Chloroflexota bacterium]
MNTPRSPRGPLLVRLLRAAILTLIGLTLLALLLAGSLMAVQRALAERIAPGIHVGEVALDGMTRAQAAEALANQYGAAEKVFYTFQHGERIWTAPALEIGLRLPAEQLAERAFVIGHADDARQNMRDIARAWLDGINLPLRYVFDEAVALRFLGDLANEINRPRQDASLRIEGLQVAIDSGESGQRLDIAATLSHLRAAVLAGRGGAIPLVVHKSPPRSWNVGEVARRVQTALSAPLRLFGTRANGDPLPPWLVMPAQIRAALSVWLQPVDGEMRFDVAVDMSAFRPFLKSLAPSLESAPVDSRLDFDPATSQLRALTPASSGRSLDVAETLRRLEAAVFSLGARRVDMVFIPRPPRFDEATTAAELGIRELVAEATTYYWGSGQNRRDNIGLGASKLHGIVVAPGEEFSFNQQLGDITAAAGYLEGSVILGGATVTGIGGGICQVSTTMYRAALKGGYAIAERHSHGYRVGYYEYAGAGPGLDAAIWQPTVDLRFRNNTPYHLLIESSFLPADDALQFRIYSTQRWTTRIEPPIIDDIVPPPPDLYIAADDLLPGQIRQVDWSAPGADVRVYRNIYDAAGALVEREAVFTRYQAWQAVYEVAAGDPRLPAAETNEDAAPEEAAE